MNLKLRAEFMKKDGFDVQVLIPDNRPLIYEVDPDLGRQLARAYNDTAAEDIRDDHRFIGCAWIYLPESPLSTSRGSHNFFRCIFHRLRYLEIQAGILQDLAALLPRGSRKHHISGILERTCNQLEDQVGVVHHQNLPVQRRSPAISIALSRFRCETTIIASRMRVSKRRRCTVAGLSRPVANSVAHSDRSLGRPACILAAARSCGSRQNTASHCDSGISRSSQPCGSRLVMIGRTMCA